MEEHAPAHLRLNDDQTIEEQSVREHCEHVAAYASRTLTGVHLAHVGKLVGLMHDIGKGTPLFEDYLRACFRGEKRRRGSVNHTFAGVRYLLDRFHSPDAPDKERLACEIIAYAAGAHHGLFDCVNADGFALRHRQCKRGIGYEDALNHLHTFCSDADANTLFREAAQELDTVFHIICALPNEQANDDTFNSSIYFCIHLLIRLITSAIIDADRRDTARFCEGKPFDPDVEDCTPPWDAISASLARHLDALPCVTAIDQARRTISRRCADFAARPSGIYRLNVPTGGGKTLSAFRFAVEHARIHGKSRILYVAPLVSILEQNAKVLRGALPDPDMLLEHHGSAILEGRVVRDGRIVEQDESGEASCSPAALLAENWHAPVIVTTLVQFLNTLFDGRTACIRRMQALCSSVILIDEVQTVPANLLSLFNLALNFLSGVCGATILLCSATQPCLEAVRYPLRVCAETPVPYDPALWAPFRRTRLLERPPVRLEALPDLVREALRSASSLLVICNTRSQAGYLFRELAGEDADLFHLSASMCMEHRRAVLRAMNASLERARGGGRKTLCISTQVIEAGVDVSFGCVVRLLAGMDSVIQSAGRCNRNRESDDPVPVYTVLCEDERLTRLPEIERGKTASAELLCAFRKDPRRFGGDLTSDEAIRFYYHRLYAAMPAGFQDDRVGDATLIDLLGLNASADGGGEDFILTQAFKTGCGAFRVFSEDTVDVIVPYDAGAEQLIASFPSEASPEHLGRVRRLLREARPYTVSVYAGEYNALFEKNALCPLYDGTVLALRPGFYDANTGLNIKGNFSGLLEV